MKVALLPKKVPSPVNLMVKESDACRTPCLLEVDRNPCSERRLRVRGAHREAQQNAHHHGDRY
jgi:hypothetical protein